jgi:hypothetical protein
MAAIHKKMTATQKNAENEAIRLTSGCFQCDCGDGYYLLASVFTLEKTVLFTGKVLRRR